MNISTKIHFSPQDFPFEKIVSWYLLHGRHDLPWRNLPHDCDPAYGVWLSEILLQQTQAQRVIPFYTRILAQFPCVSDLAKCDYETFFEYYQGLGYYSRAKNLLECARQICHTYSGVFPHDPLVLQTLPGIGEYTACAISSFAYDMPFLAFDANLSTLFGRYFFGSRFITLSSVQKFEIQEAFRQTGISSRLMNAAIMDFCTHFERKKHTPESLAAYLLPESCFIQTQGLLEVPPARKTISLSQNEGIILIFLHENHVHYFSSMDDEYVPFFLAYHGGNIRHCVQEYFSSFFACQVSVRPVFAKKYTKNSWYYCVHTQIQTGKHSFAYFQKSEKLSWMHNFFG